MPTLPLVLPAWSLACCYLLIPTPTPKPTGKALWKLDDPAVLAAERAERLAAAAEASRRKVSNLLDKKVGTDVFKYMHTACPSADVKAPPHMPPHADGVPTVACLFSVCVEGWQHGRVWLGVIK